jgi:hypothetical protein
MILNDFTSPRSGFERIPMKIKGGEMIVRIANNLVPTRETNFSIHRNDDSDCNSNGSERSDSHK